MAESRQSIRPPTKPLAMVVLVMVLFFAGVWTAISLATSGGGNRTCQGPDKTVPYNGQNIGANTARCR